jgi:CHAD domain-containing protein
MADGKWISGLRGDTPIATAARAVLGARLAPVAKFLPRAVRRAHQDVEHVHQLRVATRRCRAAIDLFRLCLGDELYERFRRTLRCIRRGAGPARDWDVFLLSLPEPQAKSSAKDAPGLHWLAGQACALRAQAQVELQAIAPEARKALIRLRRGLKRELTRPRKQPDLRQVAAPQLLALVEELEQAAARDLSQYEQLHQVRIQGKRLRYAIEVFADAFPSELKMELYPRVEQMQEILGELNDQAVAGQRVAEMRAGARRFQPQLWSLWRPGVEAFLRTARRRLALGRERFDRFWEEWLAQRMGRRFRAVVSED